jgi:predicted MFS family arabinose efflux permease
MNTSTETLWFDIALITSIFAIGNIYFGHFEDHKPKARRVAKVILMTMLFAAISFYAGRTISYLFLAALLLFGVYIHAVWLPRNGVNGLTGEPRERYEQLRGIKHS